METLDHPSVQLSHIEAQELLRRREILRRMNETISSELHLQALLPQIVRCACELVAAEVGLVGLVDEERGLVRIGASHGIALPPSLSVVPPGLGLAGQVFASRQPLVLNRYDELDRPLLPELADYSVIGIPVSRGGQMIGFLGLGVPPPRRFSPVDLEVLDLFARHAAAAIENSRLFEKERRRAGQIAAIGYVGRLISSNLDLDQLLQTTVEAISEHLHYSHIAILLVDPAEPEVLVLAAGSGIYARPEIGPYYQRIEQGLIGTAARTRQRLLIQDVRRDPRYLQLPQAGSITAELAVPLVRGERLLGVLNIESEQPISQDDADGFVAIADQLTVAIDNAHLFSETQRALGQARLLYEVGQRISTLLEVDEVIRVYLEHVAGHGPYTCQVVRYDFDEAGEQTAATVCGRWTPSQGLLLPLQESLPMLYEVFSPVLDAGQTVAVANIHTDTRVSGSLRELLAGTGQTAIALLPLMARGCRTGLVILSHPQVHPWPEVDLQLYQATAVQLAMAIDHRQQYHLLYERGQQVAVLQERQRLARELHDSVTQLIFSVTLIAQSIGPAWRRDPAEGERRIERLLELSRSALAEMRALLTELRPTEAQLPPSPEEIAGRPAKTPVPGFVRIQNEGLVAVLDSHIGDVAQDGLEVAFNSAGYIRQEQACEEALYRITQEALNNVVKHARARRVEVWLYTDPLSTQLTVSDDGSGFSRNYLEATLNVSGATSATPAHSFGLLSMRERASALGGTLRLSTVPGQGTTVAVTIPRKDRST